MYKGQLRRDVPANRLGEFDVRRTEHMADVAEPRQERLGDPAWIGEARFASGHQPLQGLGLVEGVNGG